jgi:hypothetical protein
VFERYNVTSETDIRQGAAKLSSYMAALEEKAVAAERHTIGTLEGIETVQ